MVSALVPDIVLNPAQGTVGSECEISGSGFFRGEVVDVTVTGRKVLSVAAAADGSFTSRLRLSEQLVQGRQEVTLRARGRRTSSATASFVIVAPRPTPTTEPTATESPPEPTEPEPTKAPPTKAPPPGERPTEQPSSGPELIAKPGTVSQGGELTVSGTGFEPDTGVSFRFKNSNGISWPIQGFAAADSGGRFREGLAATLPVCDMSGSVVAYYGQSADMTRDAFGNQPVEVAKASVTVLCS
jgi:hypothetical protein